MTPFITKSTPEDGTEGEPPRAREPIGTLLLEAGLLEQWQVDDAVRECGETGERLGEAVVRHGWATEDDVARLLAEQAGLDYLDRASIWFDPSALMRLSRADALHLEALPVRIEGDQVMVAVAEPTEERLAELRRRIGEDTIVVVVPKTALDGGIDLLAFGGEPTEEQEPAEVPFPDASSAPADEAPSIVAAPPAPAASPPNEREAEFDLAAQARSFADSIDAQALAMRECERRIETLEAELAASRATMLEARAQLATVLQLLDTE